MCGWLIVVSPSKAIVYLRAEGYALQAVADGSVDVVSKQKYGGGIS